jgi:hypothetical protein
MYNNQNKGFYLTEFLMILAKCLTPGPAKSGFAMTR